MAQDGPLHLFESAPADRLHPGQSTGRFMLLISILCVFGVAAGAFFWWLVSRATEAVAEQPGLVSAGQEVSRPIKVKAVAPDRSVLPERIARLLVPPVVGNADRRSHLFLSRPTRICGETADAIGASATPWEPSPVSGNGWECLIGPFPSDENEGEGNRSSVFAILRGPSSESVTQFTLMVNILHPEDEEAMMQFAENLLQPRFPEIAMPQQVLAAFAGKTELRQSALEGRFEVKNEAREGKRLRLTASFQPAASFTLPQCIPDLVGKLAEFSIRASENACAMAKET